MQDKQKTSIDKTEDLGYNKFDYKKPPNQYESWDQFLVRKLREEREYNESEC